MIYMKSRGSHTLGQLTSVDIDIMIRVFIKSYIPKVYKEGENDHNKGTHTSLMEILPLSCLPLVVRSVPKEIRSFEHCVDNV